MLCTKILLMCFDCEMLCKKTFLVVKSIYFDTVYIIHSASSDIFLYLTTEIK